MGKAPHISGGATGRMKMSGQTKFTRTLVAIAAALVMSTVSVGAAVGPAQALANPVLVDSMHVAING